VVLRVRDVELGVIHLRKEWAKYFLSAFTF